jgi:hypothetical protein
VLPTRLLISVVAKSSQGPSKCAPSAPTVNFLALLILDASFMDKGCLNLVIYCADV